VPDWRWKFEKAIRFPQNFIKHADTDAEATLDFNPHNTELMLFIDIEMFKELTGSATDPMRAFHLRRCDLWPGGVRAVPAGRARRPRRASGGDVEAGVLGVHDGPHCERAGRRHYRVSGAGARWCS